MTEAEVSTSLEGIEKAISILKDARHWTAMDVEVEAGRAREALEATQQDLENWLERKAQPPQELEGLREALEAAHYFLSHTGNHRALVGDNFSKPSIRYNELKRVTELARAALTRGASQRSETNED